MKHQICAAALALSILLVAGCAGGTSVTKVIPQFQPQATVGVNRLPSVAQVEIKPLVKRLPLGQTMPVAIIAKDANGRVLAGAFRNAIVLHGGNLSLSSTRIGNAPEGMKVTASWNRGFAGSSGWITAQPVGGRLVAIDVASSTGFVYYTVGNNPNTDDVGFQMTVGPDGKLYYGTLGYIGCPSTCTISDGAIARFDPATGKASEIEMHSGVIGLLFTSDGALWFAGGFSHQLFRLPPRAFSVKKVQTIAVPPPSGSLTYAVRNLTEDANQQVWFTDSGGSRIFKIPAAGPYKSSSLTAYNLPIGPAGTPGGFGFGQGIAYGQDGNLYVDDNDNGIVDQVSPATGATTAQLIPPQQKAIGSSGSVYTRFIVTDAGGKLFTSLIGATSSAPTEGDVDTFLPPSQKIAAIKLPSTPAGTQPDSIGVNGTNLYYADLFGALGLIDATSDKSRLYPVAPVSVLSAMTPNGIGAMPDGTSWFTCYGAGTGPFTPLCLGHTVYTSGWSLEPGPAFTIVGFGSTAAQPVGIMESPSSNSGPFTVKNDNKTACQVSKVVNHNFVITGLAAGTCNLTVKDAHGVSASIVVTVQSSSEQKKFGPFAL